MTSAAIQCVLRMSEGSSEFGPHRTVWITIRVARFSLDRAAVAGRRRRHVASAPDDDGIDEVFVQMVDELRDAIVHAPRDRQIVPHREVLHELAESDAAGV